MAEVLQAESVCIFPEGTSTLGEAVLPFKPNLFESAVVAQTPVFPLALQYFSRSTGLRSESPAFIGEMGLLESISNVINNRFLVVEITVLPAFSQSRLMGPIDRKLLAGYCQESIAQTFKRCM
jgi:1-acyl-sn-glycerol-3-phosphate acyltransferase